MRTYEISVTYQCEPSTHCVLHNLMKKKVMENKHFHGKRKLCQSNRFWHAKIRI